MPKTTTFTWRGKLDIILIELLDNICFHWLLFTVEWTPIFNACNSTCLIIAILANTKYHIPQKAVWIRPMFKGIFSTKIVIISYSKLLSFSVLTFIKWRLNTELCTVLSEAKSIFMPVARMLQHGCLFTSQIRPFYATHWQ